MAEATKSILITGASSGIGRATALRLARNGWRVFATVRKDTDAEQIEAKAVGALETVRLDVGDKDSIAAAAAEVESRLNGRGLDGLFNNAGIGSVAPVEHTSLDALRHVYEMKSTYSAKLLRSRLSYLWCAKRRVVLSMLAQWATTLRHPSPVRWLVLRPHSHP
jgi:NAD(P)-dependent dehydrogenase (short-subunit alcohol dehydrogenase family)